MVRKPPAAEQEDRLYDAVHDALRGGRAVVRETKRAGRRAGTGAGALLLYWFAIGCGLATFATLLTGGFGAFLIGAALTYGLWRLARRAGRAALRS